MTFTKEWLQQTIAAMESQRDEAPFGISDDHDMTIEALKMALAGMQAEPVAWAHRLINKRNGVVHPCVYGSAEACPSEGDIFNIEVMPLYTAPPAPVSVPDEIPRLPDGKKFKYVMNGIRFSSNYANGLNACRAAMLHGSETATDNTSQQFESLSRGDK